MTDKILVPVADSAGFAHDQIGAAFLYALTIERPVSVVFHADKRFERMIYDSAVAHNISVEVVTYNRGSFPVNLEGRIKQNEAAQQIASENGAEIVWPEELAQKLQEKGEDLVGSPVGSLLVQPRAWFMPTSSSVKAVENVLGKAAVSARQQAGVSSDADVNFLFFFGGKSLTDSEENPEQKRLGGMVKSIGAEDQIPVIRQLQEAGLAQGIVVVPVFAQYGSRKDLKQRIGDFNAEKPAHLADIVDLGVDWGNFYNPAKVFAVANQHYGAVVIGNGSTPHHQALAAVDSGQNMTVMLLRPSWSDIAGEERWDRAAAKGIVMIETAKKPIGYSYRDILDLVANKPEEALPLLVETSRDSVKQGYGALMRIWGFPALPEASPLAFEGPPPAPK